MCRFYDSALRLLFAGMVITFVVAATPASAEAQASTDSLRVEVARLAALVDSLSHEVARLRASGEPEEAEDALTALRAAAQAAADAGGSAAPPREAPSDQEFVGRQRSLQNLNPEISVSTDGFGHLNKDANGEDNFFMRVIELAVVSNLDPFSRAKIFLVRDQPGGELDPFSAEGGEHEAGSFVVEEGFVEWVGLPGGLGLKFGRFFQQFGQLNRWHQHALPVQSRSLPHIAFLGPEPLGGTGTSLHWLLPTGSGAGTYQTTWEFARKENDRLFGGAAGLSILGNFNAFWNLSEATDVDLSLSWMGGGYEDADRALDRSLYGAEVALTWRPPGRSMYRGATFRGGVMLLDGLIPAAGVDIPRAATANAVGYWSITEVRLNQSWLAGARLDWTENPQNLDEAAWLLSPTLTWWQSEYVRLRLEYDLMGRSFASAREGRLFFQATFSMGPHKHETY